MAVERFIALFKMNPEQIEGEVSNGLGYEIRGQSSRLGENELSLQIHLGVMKAVTRGLTKEESDDFQDMVSLYRDVAVVASYVTFGRRLVPEQIVSVLRHYKAGGVRLAASLPIIDILGEKELKEKIIDLKKIRFTEPQLIRSKKLR